MTVPDYVLIQGDVDSGIALCDRNTGAVYANESTVPALTVNGQGLYISGCRGGIVREGQSSNFWVFVQANGGAAPLLLTRIVVKPPIGTATIPTFTTQDVTLAGISSFARQSGRWLEGSIIFAAGLSVYRFSPGSGMATVIFTAPSGSGNLALSNLSNGLVLAFNSEHIYKLNAASGALIENWAIDTGFGLAPFALEQVQWDGANTAWVIAGSISGPVNVYALNLSAMTATQLTSGTDYSNYTLALNTVASCLGLVAQSVTTITTVPLAGGSAFTGMLPAESTGALVVDDAGFFWTADNFPTDIATRSWKIDPISLAIVLTVGYDHFASVPADDIPRGQCYGFANAAIAIGHAANLNAYDNGGAIAPSFPPGNGELLDPAGLESLRSWCRANGISVALCQDSQRTAKDLLDELFTIGNSAPVYSGDQLKIIPYDEVSAVGNGAIFISPTAAGPSGDFTDKDYAVDGKDKTAPVIWKRKRRASCDNVVAIEHIDRALDYQHNVTSEPDQVHVALYGPRKGGTLDAAELGVNIPSGTKSLISISNAAVAQAIASILAKVGSAGVNECEFTLKAEWFGVESMDLFTITDQRTGKLKVPIRLTTVVEQPDGKIKCTADEFHYGLHHPAVAATTIATGTLVLGNVDPGVVNTPIIFEPPAGMLPQGSGPQVWFLISGADPNFAGCIINVSVDGGSTYSPIGQTGPATTGMLTATYPSGADPDTTDQLKVDLTESNGSLSPQSQQIADGFADPCFVESASGFEVVCPTSATLTSTEHYTLDTYIRRGVQGTTIASHASGKRFAVIDSATFKINLPAQWVGKTIHLKFQAFNKLGGQVNPLSGCVDYTFTPVSTFLPGGFYVNGS